MIKQIKQVFVVLVCLTVGGVGHVFAATSNGCDKEENDRITPELALCSTHIYNIGGTENVPSGNSDKQLMRDVVALKTTVMTQQMNKQYEYLEAMIRRFKTQLEKAVLTTSLQAKGADAGGSSSSGSASFKSDDRNIFMAGVKNCLNYYQDADMLKCYEDNLNTIVNTSGNGASINSELKQQLVQDYCKLAGQKIGEKNNCDSSKYAGFCNNTQKAQTMDKKTFRGMIDDMRLCMQNQYRAYNNQQRALLKK